MQTDTRAAQEDRPSYTRQASLIIATTIGFLSSSMAMAENVISVATTGGDFSQLEDAIEHIKDASQSNPYLIVVSPGTYKIRSQIQLKPHVHIKGSGKKLTTLMGRIIDFSGATFVGVSGQSSIKNLTISMPRNYNFPSRVAVQCDGECPEIEDTHIDINYHPELAGYPTGIYCDSGNLHMKNSEIRVRRQYGPSYGISAGLCNLSVTDSKIISDTEAIQLEHGASATITNSKLYSGVALSIYDGNSPTTHLVENSLLQASLPIKNQTTDAGALNNVVNVRRSVLKPDNPSDPTSTGNPITCFLSDDGSGNMLNPDCSLPAVP